MTKRDRLLPAKAIIELLGGEAKVAEVANTASSAPYRWQYKKEQGGTDGLIPQRHIPKLLSYANKNDIPLSAEDFLPEQETAA